MLVKKAKNDPKKNEIKCTGESGDIGDIAKNVKIAMQKNNMTNLAKLTKLTRKFVKIVNFAKQIFNNRIESGGMDGEKTIKPINN